MPTEQSVHTLVISFLFGLFRRYFTPGPTIEGSTYITYRLAFSASSSRPKTHKGHGAMDTHEIDGEWHNMLMTSSMP